jgi:hypothetical protein
MVFSRTILCFIMSKDGKVMGLKKVEALVNMQVPTTPRRSKFPMGWHNSIGILSKNLFQSCHQSPSCSKSLKFLSGLKNVKMLGRRLKISMYKPLF